MPNKPVKDTPTKLYSKEPNQDQLIMGQHLLQPTAQARPDLGGTQCQTVDISCTEEKEVECKTVIN